MSAHGLVGYLTGDADPVVDAAGDDAPGAEMLKKGDLARSGASPLPDVGRSSSW